MATSTATFWGPSLLLLGSSISLVGCQVPSATIDPGGSQGHSNGSKPKAKAKKPKTNSRKFAVVDAELQGDGLHLYLQFSKPLGATEGVDPNDFRLSLGNSYAYRGEAAAYYYDIGYYSEYGADEEAGLATFVAMSSSANILELTLNRPFSLSYCLEIERETQEMQREPGIKAQGGLFLHYSPGQVPLRDAKGHSLAPAAEAWVLHRDNPGEDYEAGGMYLEGPAARRGFNGAIPVRCGPILPPGPR